MSSKSFELASAPPMADLFRTEAIEHRRNRLYGDVLISASPFSSAAIVLVASIGLTLVGSAIMAEYSRTETVAGIVTTTRPTTKVFAQRAGTLKSLRVIEGQVVKTGDVLADVSVDISSDDGR